MISANRSELSADLDWPAILSQLSEGVILLDAEGVIRFANQACAALFDLPGEIVGQKIDLALPDQTIAPVAYAALAGGPANRVEIKLEGTGGKRSLLIRVSRFLAPAEEAPGALLIVSDVTKERELEEASNDFVANVSHELRTPISILAGYIENLGDFPKMPRREQHEIFAIMQEHATRLNVLLNDLLTLACFDSQSDVLNYGDLDLEQFLWRLAKDWQPALSSKSMFVTLEIPEDARIIRVDRFRFEQVMHNLFDNAFKYTPIEGQIRVRSSRGDGHIEICVEDNGAGIPEEDLPHIFERFYRVDKARTRKYGGTGLGLSIVKNIIALHGGTVRAESTLGMSTRIILTLPLTPPAA